MPGKSGFNELVEWAKGTLEANLEAAEEALAASPPNWRHAHAYAAIVKVRAEKANRYVGVFGTIITRAESLIQDADTERRKPSTPP